MVHDMYLFQVKKPSESEGAWDYYSLVTTIRPIELHAAYAVEMPTAPRSPLTVGSFHRVGRGSLSLLIRPSSFADEDNQEDPVHCGRS
jgi:hypothetical protein